MVKRITEDDLMWVTDLAVRRLALLLVAQLQDENAKSATASSDLRLLKLHTPREGSLLLARIRGVVVKTLPAIRIHSVTGSRKSDQYVITITLV
jgi:hypothetical protein